MIKRNLFVQKQKENPSVAKADFCCATVTEVTSGGIRILIDGETEPTIKAYKQLNTEHTFVTGDRVVVMLQSGTCIILGTIGLPNTSVTPLPVNKGGTGSTGVTTETEIANIITAASGFTITAAKYYVWGKLAMLYIAARTTEAISVSDWHTVGTVVSGKRPAMKVQVSELNKGPEYLNADGTLEVWGTLSANKDLYFFGIYLLP